MKTEAGQYTLWYIPAGKVPDKDLRETQPCAPMVPAVALAEHVQKWREGHATAGMHERPLAGAEKLRGADWWKATAERNSRHSFGWEFTGFAVVACVIYLIIHGLASL